MPRVGQQWKEGLREFDTLLPESPGEKEVEQLRVLLRRAEGVGTMSDTWTPYTGPDKQQLIAKALEGYLDEEGAEEEAGAEGEADAEAEGEVEAEVEGEEQGDSGGEADLEVELVEADETRTEEAAGEPAEDLCKGGVDPPEPVAAVR